MGSRRQHETAPRPALFAVLDEPLCRTRASSVIVDAKLTPEGRYAVWVGELEQSRYIEVRDLRQHLLAQVERIVAGAATMIG